jgi:hypothetical protein
MTYCVPSSRNEAETRAGSRVQAGQGRDSLGPGTPAETSQNSDKIEIDFSSINSFNFGENDHLSHSFGGSDCCSKKYQNVILLMERQISQEIETVLPNFNRGWGPADCRIKRSLRASRSTKPNSMGENQ